MSLDIGFRHIPPVSLHIFLRGGSSARRDRRSGGLFCFMFMFGRIIFFKALCMKLSCRMSKLFI